MGFLRGRKAMHIMYMAFLPGGEAMHGACTSFPPGAAAVHGAFMGFPPGEQKVCRQQSRRHPGSLSVIRGARLAPPRAVPETTESGAGTAGETRIDDLEALENLEIPRITGDQLCDAVV